MLDVRHEKSFFKEQHYSVILYILNSIVIIFLIGVFLKLIMREFKIIGEMHLNKGFFNIQYSTKSLTSISNKSIESLKISFPPYRISYKNKVCREVNFFSGQKWYKFYILLSNEEHKELSSFYPSSSLETQARQVSQSKVRDNPTKTRPL